MKNSHDFQYKIPTIFNFVQKNAQNKALYAGAYDFSTLPSFFHLLAHKVSLLVAKIYTFGIKH